MVIQCAFPHCKNKRYGWAPQSLDKTNSSSSSSKSDTSDAVENKLDSKEWPHQSECPSVWNGSGAVSARQKHKASGPDERRSGARLIIFVIGGISYSEMRCAYEVTQAVKSCEVIIGSSHILTPTRLLDDIHSLSKAPMQTFTIENENSSTA